MNPSPQSGDNASREHIATRRVYYIGGFDPRGAGYYHRLYKDEAGKQIVHSGITMKVGRRSKISPHQHSWEIKSEHAGRSTTTDYRFLGWDDIVRRHWESDLFKLLATTVKSYTKFVACGALGRIRAHYRGPFFSGVYPIIFLAVIAVFAVGCGIGSGIMLAKTVSNFGSALAAGLFIAAVCFWLGLKLADRLGVLWLLRTYLFVYAWGEAIPDTLDQRLNEFSDIIARDQGHQACDEIIIVGHSVGSILAVSVLARVLDRHAEVQMRNVTLVTLGQCIPLLSLIPAAVPFRHELKTLVEHPDIPWLDMAARADPLCFSQADTAQVSGIGSPDVKWPRVHIVRPFKMFAPEKYRRIKHNKLRLHFQYLMASDLPTDYDYFLMTAGLDRLSLPGT